jgi:hypothetical protein
MENGQQQKTLLAEVVESLTDEITKLAKLITDRPEPVPPPRSATLSATGSRRDQRAPWPDSKVSRSKAPGAAGRVHPSFSRATGYAPGHSQESS